MAKWSKTLEFESESNIALVQILAVAMVSIHGNTSWYVFRIVREETTFRPFTESSLVLLVTDEPKVKFGTSAGIVGVSMRPQQELIVGLTLDYSRNCGSEHGLQLELWDLVWTTAGIVGVSMDYSWNCGSDWNCESEHGLQLELWDLVWTTAGIVGMSKNYSWNCGSEYGLQLELWE
ncbi:hypothetical protein J6590_035464 [Homalodisca vitripennis]|nr:hypothetical protein J6590_035464 [Homalodisca vitripennis]